MHFNWNSVRQPGPQDVALQDNCSLVWHHYFLFFNTHSTLQYIWKSTFSLASSVQEEDKENTAKWKGSHSQHLYPPALLNLAPWKHLFEGIDCRLIMRSSDLKFRRVILKPESRSFKLCPVGRSWVGKLVTSCTFLAISVCIHASHLIPTSAELLSGQQFEAGCIGQLPDMRTFVHKSVAPLLL